MRTIFTSFLFLLISSQAFALRNDALLVGGGCEHRSKSPVNLFSHQFELTYRALKNSHRWNIEVQYGNNQWDKPWPGATNSTRENLFAYLDKRIKGPDALKKGDQLLLAIATHGSEPPHMVCMGDDDHVWIYELSAYISQLTLKGVKVAVTDSSCYSGYTAYLLSGIGACAVAEGNPNTTGDGDAFNGILYGQGLSAEDRAHPPSYYDLSIPHETADLNQDGKISLAEAYRIAFLRSGVNSTMIPRTTECNLKKYGVIDLIDKIAPFFRSAGYREEVAQIASQIDLPIKDETLLALSLLPETFSKVIQASDSKFQEKWLKDLAFFGSDHLDSAQDWLVEMQKSIHVLIANYPERTGKALPPALSSLNLTDDEKQMLSFDNWKLKSSLLKQIKSLVDFSCELEKQSKKQKTLKASACEEFELF